MSRSSVHYVPVGNRCRYCAILNRRSIVAFSRLSFQVKAMLGTIAVTGPTVRDSFPPYSPSGGGAACSLSLAAPHFYVRSLILYSPLGMESAMRLEFPDSISDHSFVFVFFPDAGEHQERPCQSLLA
jgi:hypothetical protein